MTKPAPKAKRTRKARAIQPSKLSARAREIIARTKANRTKLYVETLGAVEPPHVVPYPLERQPILPVDPPDDD